MNLLRCLACAVLCALLLAGRVQALPANEVDTEYYAEAQHRRLVGERILSCSGGVHSWGRVTAFALRSSQPCGPHHTGGSTANAEQLMFRLHGCPKALPPGTPDQGGGPDNVFE